MCGRFAQGFAVRVIAEQLERGEMGIDDIRDLDDHYPTYNAAPTTYQAVYRRERSSNQDHTDAAVEGRDVVSSVPTAQTTTQVQETDDSAPPRTRHVLQGMKWGLIPFWTKRAPDSASQLKTINCRDDSLLENRGMWNSMKGRKRCVVPVQGYYEWLKKGPKEKVPHFTKRKDGELMMLAGLYDCVQYEGSGHRIWTFTIITTSANNSLAWLHDRMPLILEPRSKELERWLDDDTWSQDLARLLKPYEGELDCYPVKKEVGKVGNNSADFIIPIDSKENKSNIANFFQKQPGMSPTKAELKTEEVVKEEETDRSVKHEGVELDTNAPLPDHDESESRRSAKAVTEDKKPVLGEDDLPFRFIPSHLESRTLETMDVFTASISPQDTSKVIKFINTELGREAENLSHLKRIRSSKAVDGSTRKKIKLEEGESAPLKMDILLCSCSSRSQADLAQLLSKHNIDLQIDTTVVSLHPPLTTKQFSEWCELWPLSWRVPAQRKVKMTRSEFDECEKIMDSMLDSASLMASSPDLPVTAVAWNPITKSEVARSSDHRTSSGHPLKHAIMELVSSVAAYEVIRRIEEPEGESQYLCSNLYIFVSHEPCTMCCMALLHSRVAKVFYAQKMDKTGGFESNYGIHWRAELNHRFVVFGGWKSERAGYIEENTDGSEDGLFVGQQLTVEDEVDDLEVELYSDHVPRTFTESFAHDESNDDDDDDDDDDESDASFIVKEEPGTGPVEVSESRPTPTPTIQHAKSRPRRPRPRMKKKTPKMTDFFGKQS